MTEREIDNRGSKSIIQVSECIIVKEQRVDGSWQDIKSNRSCLRCTLTGFERNCPNRQFLSQNLKNYQIRALSKLINKNTIRYYSSQPVQQYEHKMNPWFLTGFVDAEGCFTLRINRNKNCETDWNVQLIFQIALHRKDNELLEGIKN